MGISIEDFLYKYFKKPNLEFALDAIGESISGNFDDLVERIIDTWKNYRDIYDSLDALEEDILLDICDDFKISYQSTSHQALKSRIKKAGILGKGHSPTKFQKESSTKKNTEPKKQKPKKKNLIRIIFFPVILTLFFGYLLTDDGTENFLIFIGYMPEDGIYYDSIYKSYSGGFYIIKPGTSWILGDIEQTTASSLKAWEHEFFIDGAILESSKGNVHMSVWVFSEEYLPHVPLIDAFEDVFKNSISVKNDVVSIGDTRYSTVGDEWIEKELMGIEDGKFQHTKYKIQIHENRFHIIQDVLWNPDTATENDLKDFEDAWNSVAFCSSSVNCND